MTDQEREMLIIFVARLGLLWCIGWSLGVCFAYLVRIIRERKRK